MPLPPTPWLNPPDYTGAFLRGAQIGASATESRNRLAASVMEANARINAAASEQNARLAQQEQMAQMQAQVRMQIADQRSRENQQRIAIDASYKDAEIGLQRQRLEESQKLSSMKIMQQAQQMDAQMRMSERIKRGEPRDQVLMEEGPLAFGGSAMGGIMRAAQASAPKSLEIKAEGGEQFYRSSPSERYQHIPKSNVEKVMQNKIIDASNKRIDALDKYRREFAETPQDKESAMQMILTEKRKQNAIYRDRGEDVPFPEVTGEVGDVEANYEIGKGFSPVGE